MPVASADGGGGPGAGIGVGAAASAPSGIQFGQFRVIDVPEVLEACRKENIPTPWLGKPNSYAPVLGCAAGRGWILMYQSDVLAMDLNALYTLKFSQNNDSRSWKNLLVVGQPECVLPSFRSDPNSPYLVEIADRKRLISAVPIDKGYNVRQCTGGSYYSGTLNSGSPWTWSLMIGDIWAACLKLGTYPGLPITPDGTPENFVFNACYALEALGSVLEKLGLALAYNNTTDVFSLVAIGADDPSASAALTAWDGNRINDTAPRFAARGTVPEKVRVCFPKLNASADLTGVGWDYPIDVSPVTPVIGVEPDTVAILHDDLSAVYDSGGSLTNLAALNTRAAAVAAQYYQRVTQNNLYRVFDGPKGDAGLAPGSLIKAGRWSNLGRGSVCEVYRSYGLVDPGMDNSSATGRFADERTSVFDYSPTFSWFENESGRKRSKNLGALAQIMKYYLAACWGSGSGLLTNIIIYNTPGSFTYTPTAGISFALAWAQAGGSGGGGTTGGVSGGAVGGGGGPGGTAYGKVSIASIGASQTITVGSGGSGGTAGSDGSAGGDSSFGSLVYGQAGGGGQGMLNTTAITISSSGITGIGTAGDLLSFGCSPAVVGIFLTTTAVAGNGGSSPFGSGGRGVVGIGNADGQNGRGYGSGGSGANAGLTNRDGGNGSGGLVLVVEYK